MLQRLWVLRLSWADLLPDNIKGLGEPNYPNLPTIHYQRCYFVRSISKYAASSPPRLHTGGPGEVDTAIMMAKSRIAPDDHPKTGVVRISHAGKELNRPEGGGGGGGRGSPTIYSGKFVLEISSKR